MRGAARPALQSASGWPKVASRVAPACLLVLLAGCGPGVRWRYEWSFYQAFGDSKSNEKLTFVFFRQYYSVACTQMDDQVFNTPELQEATRDMNCIRPELDLQKSLAAAWGVDSVPSYVIVAPTGRVLIQRVGMFTVDQVLADIQQARQTYFGLPGAAGRAP